MKITVPSLVLLAHSILLAQNSGTEAQVANAVRALPEALRQGATVVAFNSDGKSTVLRHGTNNMVCWADEPTPGFSVYCFPNSMEPYELRRRELRGVVGGQEILDKEIDSHKVLMPNVAVRYQLSGDSPEVALPIMIVHIPYATAASTGLSTAPDNYRPWLMFAGSPRAHIMVPGK